MYRLNSFLYTEMSEIISVLLIHANIEGVFELVLTGDRMAKSVVYLGYLIAPMHPSGVHLFS